MGQLPVAYAQNILPDRITSGHVTDVTSGHATSGHAQWSDPPQIRLCPSPYTTDDILVCTRINIQQHFLTHLQINNATTFFYHTYISIKYTPLVSCGVNMYVNYKYRPLYGVCWYL
jgi:hypothetical protein